MYAPKLKKTGLMCGHDYTTKHGFGVIQAVDEFVLERGFEWVCNSKKWDWAVREPIT